VGYEWDATKAERNLRKHGVDFADAVGVFDDPLALTRPDTHSGELRFVTLGEDSLGRLPVVAYAWRETRIRVISARRATRGERQAYED
jgi:uncharacterized protein